MNQSQTEPRRQIPPGRQVLHYLGLSLVVIGALQFFSMFLPGCADSSPRLPPEVSGYLERHHVGFSRSRDDGQDRAVTGMVLIVVGSVLTGIGQRGWAGSGLVLDPEQARKDIEPWNRAAGGTVSDMLSEVEVVQKAIDGLATPREVIKVRCRQCQALNDEVARFCNQCGRTL